MCSRCVRFTREVSGGGELQIVDRGSHAEIDIFPGYPLADKMSGNTNDICPVGALCSTDFLYQQRVWFMDAQDSVCTRCSTGCSVQLHVQQNRLCRVQPRFNPNANDWWMCDIGRYENDYISAPERLNSIKRRADDKFLDLLWPEGLQAIQEALAAIASKSGGDHLAFVLSPFLTCEEAFLLATYARTISANVQLVQGKIPVVGQDETFKSGFTIRSERCPNRRGVEEVLRHFQPIPLDWDRFVQKIAASEITGVYLTANYPNSWINEAEAVEFGRLELLVAQDILPSPLARKAHFVVPGVTSVEKDGSYVNHAGLIQSTEWGIRPVEGAHVDGQTFSDLLGRKGLYQADIVLAELAAAIPFFTRAAGGVPEAGLNLATGSEKTPKTTALGTVTHPLPTFRSVASEMLEVE
jgi:NADH-quinone oxidoreductase subunit G